MRPLTMSSFFPSPFAHSRKLLKGVCGLVGEQWILEKQQERGKGRINRCKLGSVSLSSSRISQFISWILPFELTVIDNSLYLFTAALSRVFCAEGFKAIIETERRLIKQDWGFSGRWLHHLIWFIYMTTGHSNAFE